MKRTFLLVFMLIGILTLPACATLTGTPSTTALPPTMISTIQIPASTLTPLPTVTSTPKPTFTPTSIPASTSTPVPTFTATAATSLPANAWPTPTLSDSDPTVTPEIGDGQARTQHLDIIYPGGKEAQVQEFLSYAEDVYADINYYFGGVLPPIVNVTLVDEGISKATWGGFTLSLQHGIQVEQVYAHEMVHVAHREITGKTYEEESYLFFVEGLASWVEERYERKMGQQEPRWRLAAYGYHQGWANLEYIEAFEHARREIGGSIAYAIGYSFVVQFVDLYGHDGLMALLFAMKDNTDICSALGTAGYECEAFITSWQTRLEEEAVRYDFSNLPKITAELLVTGEGDIRDVSVRVHIINPEASSYKYFVSYVLGEEWREQQRWEENQYQADSSDFEAVIPLGQMRVDDTVMWNAGLWSDTAYTWIKSGWQEEIIYSTAKVDR